MSLGRFSHDPKSTVRCFSNGRGVENKNRLFPFDFAKNNCAPGKLYTRPRRPTLRGAAIFRWAVVQHAHREAEYYWAASVIVRRIYLRIPTARGRLAALLRARATRHNNNKRFVDETSRRALRRNNTRVYENSRFFKSSDTLFPIAFLTQ